ncbi:MAG: preprotein translocase subunit YajC [Clostridia bacterium]|nr:preprotein translocase subunit YajC [Clostridia bacterium]
MLLDAGTTTTGSNDLSGLLSLLIFPLLLVIMYFFMIRPQRKQEKEAAAMRDSLSVGDEITTIGGIIGRVINVKDDTFVLETTRDRTRIRFERSAIKRIDRKYDAPVVTEAPAEEPAENKEENK